MPDKVPQQTFIEVRAAGIAIAAGPTLRDWHEVEGEVALRHAMPGAPLEIKLMGRPLLDRLGRTVSIDGLREECGRLGIASLLLLHILIGSALERAERRELYLTVSLDDLIAAIGWRPQSTAERARMRLTVWRWLLLFDALMVIGRRPGTFRDPRTRQVLDLESHDALIRVMGWMVPEGQDLDSTAPPLEVTIAAGPWLERWRGLRHILTYFGEVRRLASIPAGKPSGAWAQALGLALQQIWRERAARAGIKRVGGEKRPTANVGAFTRRRLLKMFPPDPSVDDILGGSNPKRAQTYWDEAIKLLKQSGLIGYYREKSPPPDKRAGWADCWLDQHIDIRPRADDLEATIEIAQSAGASSPARRRTRPAVSCTDGETGPD